MPICPLFVICLRRSALSLCFKSCAPGCFPTTTRGGPIWIASQGRSDCRSRILHDTINTITLETIATIVHAESTISKSGPVRVSRQSCAQTRTYRYDHHSFIRSLLHRRIHSPHSHSHHGTYLIVVWTQISIRVRVERLGMMCVLRARGCRCHDSGACTCPARICNHRRAASRGRVH